MASDYGDEAGEKMLDNFTRFGERMGERAMYAHADRMQLTEPVIAEVASNHGVSPAQILIRWHLRNNNICIPGSSNPEHIRQDADVFSFSLSSDEMAAIDGLDRNQRFASH